MCKKPEMTEEVTAYRPSDFPFIDPIRFFAS